MEVKKVKGLVEAYASIYTNITEDHFKVGDEVVCKASGMEGEIVKLDKAHGEDDEKYYTVKREDGKTMKYAPNELKLAEKEGKEEEEKEEKGEKEEKEDVKEAKNGGASKKSETSFHLNLDKLVHKTFGSSPEEKKKMKEEVEQIDEADSIAAMRERAAKRRKQRYGASDTSRGGRDDYRPYTKADYERGEANDPRKKTDEEVDIFDTILEHLVAEGYADTNQAAIAIMANMSEEWRQSIVEGPVGEFADNVARTAGTAVGTVQRGADYLRQKARNVAGTFEIARDRAASGMSSNTVGPIKQQPRGPEFSHGGPEQKKASSTKPIPIPNPNRRVPDFVERRARG